MGDSKKMVIFMQNGIERILEESVTSLENKLSRDFGYRKVNKGVTCLLNSTAIV